jgi:hypothetical protein
VIPLTISASSLEVAAKCMARYKASMLDKGSGFGHPAAMLGTVLHGALEAFTDPDYVKTGNWEWDHLYECYLNSWRAVFGEDMKSDWFSDGRMILQKWYNRSDQQSDIQDVDIISREVKKNFLVPYVDSVGEKQTTPCNYIIDRLDQLDEDVFRVVDYKSQRQPLNPGDLKSKMQARLYALAIQIEYPAAKEIWVQFDFLRYDRVAVLFSRDDNAETWRHIKRELQKIIDTPENDPPETLNSECKYCVRKFTCKALQSNIRVGGIFSLGMDELAVIYDQMKGQVEGIKSVLDDIELQLLRHAEAEDMLEWETPTHRMKVTAGKRRKINRTLMAQILGPELMAEYGRLLVGDIDLLRKDPRLNPAQLSMLDTAIEFEFSDPSIKVMKKT